MRDTVPHEVAHYIVHEVYPRRATKPHGHQWKSLMAQFDADAGVTFALDLDGVPQRRQSSHRYHCGCRIHEVSSTRHNRAQRGTARYLCRFCNDSLVFICPDHRGSPPRTRRLRDPCGRCRVLRRSNP